MSTAAGHSAAEALNPQDAAHKWAVTGTVMLGTVMAVLDSSIINVALPSMGGSLGVGVEEIAWVVTGYILAQVIVMPITALLSERFGRKNFYLFCIALFTLSSMLCGAARTLLRVEIIEDERSLTTKVVDQLMGNKPEARFRFIQERAEFAKPDELDI